MVKLFFKTCLLYPRVFACALQSRSCLWGGIGADAALGSGNLLVRCQSSCVTPKLYWEVLQVRSISRILPRTIALSACDSQTWRITLPPINLWKIVGALFSGAGSTSTCALLAFQLRLGSCVAFWDRKSDLWNKSCPLNSILTSWAHNLLQTRQPLLL